VPAPKKPTTATKKNQPVEANISIAIPSTQRIVIRENNLAIAKCDFIQVNSCIPANIEMNKAVLIEMALLGLLDKEGMVVNCIAKINEKLNNETIVFS